MTAVSIAGTGITQQGRFDGNPEDLASRAVRDALAMAELVPSDVGLVLVANALGGALADQECIRGQTWLRGLRLGNTPVVNVDNACAASASALHLAVSYVEAGGGPVLVVGVEKMFVPERGRTVAAIEQGLPADERHAFRQTADVPSILMAMNATWAQELLDQGRATLDQFAAVAVKARQHGAANPVAQYQVPVTGDEVLSSRVVVSPLTRLMCSSFTDGAAAVVLTRGPSRGAAIIRTSLVRSGDGSLDYHDRLRETAKACWKESGIGPGDLDVIEIHDATAPEELYALESLGFFPPGEAGARTAAGDTGIGGRGVTVNPSGGLLARGHAIGATGLCQVIELAQHLQGTAGGRQVPGARLGFSVNTGGIVTKDAATVAMHVLEAR